MYLKLLLTDDFVKINKLKEVTDPIYMIHNKPTENGLFSESIFGITQYDRQNTWAYIDLGAKILHPLAAINFKRYASKFENIIYGLKTYKFENGEFIEDPSGETGIDFLYDCYDNIKWRETESITGQETINFLKQGKNNLFITKFPVCPPFYRDITADFNIGGAINDLYRKLIHLSSSNKNSGFSFFGNLTRAEMQKCAVGIYNYFIDKLKGKIGLMRRYVMGRNIDYGAWLVLSAPKITGDKYTDMQIDFDHFGYPLHAILSMFKPFILQGVKNFFDEEFKRGGNYIFKNPKTGESIRLDFIDPEKEFSEDYINKKIDQFINGPSTRFESIKLPKNEQGIEGDVLLTGRFNDSSLKTRSMTWTDVFYIIATQETANKHVMQSRYPTEHFYSVAYCKIAVMSTIETEKAEIDGVIYKWYPKVYPNKDSGNSFINTLSPCNVYLAAEGADFDGDSTPNRSLFTVEANMDAERFMRDKKNFLNLVGKNIRKTERDFIQLIYSLSAPTDKVELEDPN